MSSFNFKDRNILVTANELIFWNFSSNINLN